MTYSLPVLDHGFVTLRNLAGPTRRAYDYCGDSVGEDTVQFLDGRHGGRSADIRDFDADDTDVANAARMSFDGMDQDRTYDIEMKLNRYLLVNKHMTPFEVIEVWLEMKLPIFVARQLVRQRTQTLNELSGRYKQLPAEWYIPTTVGGKPVGGAKQGQSDTLNEETQTWFKVMLDQDCSRGYYAYEEAIRRGVALEHARMFLHVNHYTHWLAKMNLRNLMISFLSLRDHSHAQVESQQYARATIQLIEPHLPGLMKLYTDLVKVV